jgi:hypothetical protein
VAPFALDAAFAAGLHDGASHSATINGDGTIAAGGNTVGRFVANRLSINTVGQELPVAAVPASCDDHAGYAPVYATVGAAQRIVGFIVLGWSSCDVGAVTLDSTTVARVAPANATTVIAEGLLAALAPADVAALIAANRNLAVPLLAAALAR